MKDSFYIGYQSHMSQHLAKWIVAVSATLMAGFLLTLFVWTPTLSDAGTGTYAFGNPQEWTGRVEITPYPVLWITNEDQSESEFLLVAPFKNGADSLMADYQNQYVRLRGTLISRSGISMIELEGNPIEVLRSHDVDSSAAPQSVAGAPITLTGQIVDSKCWLGVMNPGEGIVHRACATLCIRGGIPPAFVYQDEADQLAFALILNTDGRPFGSSILPHVARQITLSGTLDQGTGGRNHRFLVDQLD